MEAVHKYKKRVNAAETYQCYIKACVYIMDTRVWGVLGVGGT